MLFEAVNRSPKRTRKGVASIEIVINMLASAVNWAVIKPPDCAVLKKDEAKLAASEPRPAISEDPVEGKAQQNASAKIIENLITRITAVCNNSGAQDCDYLQVDRKSDAKNNKASRVVLTGSTIIAMR